MFHPWHELEPGPDAPDRMHVVVEIPRGSRNKYELDKNTGMFKLDRLLYSSVHYPGDYGFFPQTYAQDDDPLDAIVMTTVPTFPGCIIEVRPIGIFRMTDKDEMDEKVLCVPARDPLYDGYAALTDVAPHFLREVEHFFSVYKDLEGGRVHPMGWEDEASARAVIVECMARYAVKRQAENLGRIAQQSASERAGHEL
ncbi:inorganic diphosphatase [Longimicrobium terrae]|uniref:Inorganic pyrophosphatase n=1 Tax=Longimicrobium terrae TaxID=1639882 RepID=A0A841GU32_9BACT|nr:inorganic diphosphatase [Longimicrobium terrae]MBB4634717.1 inorganic pyrophosphatase [Longimicrobium terrae]MBB6068393.1 inorganic pyrophosphatase [Longimicrobium terrae]NNC32673.1 inorganic diphosphatase [Longimicrobium terrae]